MTWTRVEGANLIEYSDEWIKLFGSNYMMIGDLDKPFHRPECECSKCEDWRAKNSRPTHKYIRSL